METVKDILIFCNAAVFYDYKKKVLLMKLIELVNA